MDGFNVTIPYKTEVIPYLDGLTEEAARIGAVNTVAVREGRRLGYNTDYTGFSRTVDAIGADPAGKERWCSARAALRGRSSSASLTGARRISPWRPAIRRR